MDADGHLVKEGHHIMLRRADTLRIFQVYKDRDAFLEKCKFKMNSLIGQPYGSLYEVKDGQMVKIERTIHQDTDTTDEGRDNRNLQDSDSNQKLTQEEIEQMKKEGISGDVLIGQLIENSATFQSKTGYAQEKWVKKKKKKHLLQYTVLKPTVRLMCEMLWSKGPSRILNLRVDSLAQMLTMGNVRANSTVMVVDSCLGLVTAGVLERLGGFGKVISFYHGDSPVCYNLGTYNFPKEIMDTLYNFPLELVSSLKQTGTEQQLTESCTEQAESLDQSENKQDGHTTVNPSDSANVPDIQTGTTVCSEVVSSEVQQKENQSGSGLQETVHNGNQPEEYNAKANKWNKKRNKSQKKKNRIERKVNRAKEIEEARRIIQQKNVDCLIVASKFYPTPIVLTLLDFVAPSRQVVVHCQFKEALTDCYTYLREYKGLLNYRLTETWLREYQVLPDRTHPVIQMSGTGGYLLTATTCIKPKT